MPTNSAGYRTANLDSDPVQMAAQLSAFNQIQTVQLANLDAQIQVLQALLVAL
jgi:hypothetical protein